MKMSLIVQAHQLKTPLKRLNELNRPGFPAPSSKAWEGPTTTGCPMSFNSGGSDPLHYSGASRKSDHFPPESLITLRRIR